MSAEERDIERQRVREAQAKRRANLTPEEKARALAKRREQRQPGADLGSTLLRTYGITLEHYEDMLVDQSYECALCNADIERAGEGHHYTKVANVDHCHATGKVRGLLCHKCNKALGMFHDDVEALRRAADYIERNSQ